MQRALIIFVKNPVLGEVKTRLAATIGEEAALHVYHQLLNYTREVTSQLDVPKFVYYHSHIGSSDLWDELEYTKRVQASSDLGGRMKSALEDVLNEGEAMVCLIGSDCPALTAEYVDTAMTSLRQADVVLGPSLDGGYYLIGVKAVYNELFDNINWSTDQVLSTTLERCKSLDLKVTLLPELSDVDVEADLRKYPWLLDKL